MTKAADNTPHVVVRNVSHAFRRGRPPVLSGVDLTVARGEAVAVVGRSGCGKSTLLHTWPACCILPAAASTSAGTASPARRRAGTSCPRSRRYSRG